MSLPSVQVDGGEVLRMHDEFMELLHARRGHFLLESGHHGDLWLDLELLFLRPQRVHPFAVDLARRLRQYQVDAVCAPLVEGAFVGLIVAKELDVEFFYTTPINRSREDTLFPIEYRLPPALRGQIAGKRVAIVNDVINAGSAVRGTLIDLKSQSVETVAIGTLLTLGDVPAALADEFNVGLVTVAAQANSIWEPADCPICVRGEPLDNV